MRWWLLVLVGIARTASAEPARFDVQIQTRHLEDNRITHVDRATFVATCTTRGHRHRTVTCDRELSLTAPGWHLHFDRGGLSSGQRIEHSPDEVVITSVLRIEYRSMPLDVARDAWLDRTRRR